MRKIRSHGTNHRCINRFDRITATTIAAGLIVAAQSMSGLAGSTAPSTAPTPNVPAVPSYPQPTPTPLPNPLPTPAPAVKGVMEFSITPFANMEHGYHIFEPGYRAVCADSSGVVATAKLSIDAAINGNAVGSKGAYPSLIIRPEAQFIRKNATSGSCQLDICLDGNAESPTAGASCRSTASAVGDDAERATSFSGQVNYQVSGNQISLQTGSPGLSAWHPVFSFAAPTKAFKDFQSPLVLDLDGNGKIDLTDVNDPQHTVKFDMALEGAAVRTGWVSSEDAFLAVDLNGNGQIDNSGELFGEYFTGQVLGPKPFRNGFLALASFDENDDGQISQKDTRFAELVLWRDANQDGLTQPMELVPLKSAGIESLSLLAKDTFTQKSGNFAKVANNEIRLIGQFTRIDGSKGTIADVWFQVRRLPLASSAHEKWLTATNPQRK